MMRFSFLPRRGFPIAWQAVDWISYVESSPRMQYAFVICAFSVLLCSFLSLWENAELRVAQLRYERARIEAAAIEERMVHLRSVTNVVEQLGQKAREVAAVRARTVTHVQAIEEVGDQVSRRAWLVALHEEAGSLHLRGRARSASDVGEMLADLHHVNSLHNARLDALHALENNRGGVVEFDILLSEAAP